jgi:uncharacterized repeat protein (TIGR03806 family)
MFLRLLALLIVTWSTVSAAVLPAGFSETRVATLSGPTTMAFAPDGRAFVCQQSGVVRVIKNGVLLPVPFVDLSSVVDSVNERGLESICFDPDFATNQWVYVYYTRIAGADRFNRVARFTATGDVASGGETVIFDLSLLSTASNHNGGGMRFGKDGKLWISAGENVVDYAARSLNTTAGKLLRINKDGTIPGDNPYNASIPAGDPKRAIVALGLRNPFTMSIHPTSGMLFINDVGDGWEEINRYDTDVPPVRRDFGFNRGINGGGLQGFAPVNGTKPADYRDPEQSYTLNKNAVCGGDFYLPASPGAGAFPASFRGRYFFCDYNGWIASIDPAVPGTRDVPTNKVEFATGCASPTDLDIASDGALWYVSRGNGGGVWRVTWTGAVGPTPTALAVVQQPTTVNASATITPAVQIAVRDAAGNTVTSSSATVTLALGANPGGATLSGTTSVAAVNGVATFSNLSLNNAGTGYTLVASSTGLTSATSSTFNVQAQVTTPVITPDGGSYSGPVWVQIATATSGTTIRYTVDGSTPTASSPTYTAPFQRAATTTVRAYATRSGFTDSAVASTTITVSGSSAYGLDYRPPVTGVAMPAVVSGSLPATLSATGMFQTIGTMAVKAGVVPYTVNSPLWSDNASKGRWVALPDAAKIGFNATGEFTWPGGTVLMKHFDLTVNEATGAKRRLETRLLVLDASGTNGYGVTYKWRADNTEADLLVAGGQDETITITNASGGTRTQVWHYPSRDQCLQCHTANAGFVLGPKTRQLNGTYTYPSTGRSDNQLRTWNYLQMFTTRIDEAAIAGLRKTVPLTDTTASLETRARSYLDANCAGCHRPGGAGTLWDARFDTPVDSQGIIQGDLLRGNLGITGGKVVVPQDLAKSIMHLRMQSTDPLQQMPPLGRNVVHTAAVDLLALWIGSLPNGSGLRGEYFSNQDKTFTGAATVTRIDPVVDFSWDVNAPVTGVSADTFTVRWTGTVQPAASETYTFFTTTDDGVRLWVNNQLVIDRWVNQGASEWSGTIALTAGQQYDLRLEYFEGGGGASAQLRWSSASTPKAIVPMYRLFPAAGTGQTFAAVVVTPASATVVNGGSVRFVAEARDTAGAPLTTQPPITWSVSGGGSIAADGTFTATTIGGPYTVTANATVAGTTRSSTAAVTVQSGFSARINFQPATAPTVAGWSVDAGLVFGARAGGLTYGWNADVSGGLRDRNLLTDQLRDTVVHLQRAPVPDAVWEIAVPNGSYQVTAVCGDAGYFDSIHQLTAEGVLIVNGTPTSANRFVETPVGGAVVIVNDGRLTLRSGVGASNAKLNLVEILQLPTANQ